MDVTKTSILGNSYYDHSSFNNTIFSTILALYDYFENLLFPNDPQRIVYSSNDFAFRRRLQTQKREDVSNFQIQSLNMPFMNFSLSSNGISNTPNRNLKNSQVEIFGAMNYDINKKLRLSPLQLSFEATFFSNEERDIQYVMSELLWVEERETLIFPEIEIDGETFQNYGNFEFSNLGYNPRYTEKDWLEQNKIRTISMDFIFDTYLIKTDTTHFWIPQEVLFAFAHKYDIPIEDWSNYDELYEGVIDHIEEEVTFS